MTASIIIALFAYFMFASAWLSVDANGVSKIDDVKHIEGLDEIDNIEKIDETYELSEIGLTNKQEQQIMDEKDITTKNEIHSGTVVLKTDTGLYIAYTERVYPNILTETIMSLVSFILFFCMMFVPIILDNRFLWDALQVVATGGSIISSLFCIFSLVVLL
jgi:hypothetical protein